MKPQPGLRTALDDLDTFGDASCVGYDLCLKACPVVDEDLPIFELNEAASDPAGMTARVREFVIDCVQCGRCTEACPAGVPRDQMMLKLRAGLPERPPRYAAYGRLKGGHGLQPWYLDALAGAFGLAYRGRVDKRLRPHLDKPRLRQADTLLYFGCYAFSHTGSPGVTLDLAEELGEDVEVLAGLRTCCGWPQYLSGDIERAEELMLGLERQILQARPKVVVSGCAECVAAVQVIARRNGGDFESISTVEWLRRNRDKLDLEPGELPITFHDSCHLSRKLHREDSARELGEGLFELREMEQHGRDGSCCGYYSFGLSPDKAGALRRDRLDQARATGAGVMAVECVTCQESFEGSRREGDVRVVELQKLVLDAVRAKR